MDIEEQKPVIDSKEPNKESRQKHITSTRTVPVVVKSEETDEGCELKQIMSEHNYHKNKCIREGTKGQEFAEDNTECCSTEDEEEVLTMKCEVFDEPLIPEKEHRIKKENAEDSTECCSTEDEEEVLTMKCEVFDEPLIPEKGHRIKKENAEDSTECCSTEDEEEVLTMKCEVFDEPHIPEKEHRIKKENAEDSTECCSTEDEEEVLTMKCEVFDEPHIPEKEHRIKKENAEDFSIAEDRTECCSTEDEKEVLTMKCEVFDKPLIPENTEVHRMKKKETKEKEHRIEKENAGFSIAEDNNTECCSTEDDEEVLTMKCEVFDEPLILRTRLSRSRSRCRSAISASPTLAEGGLTDDNSRSDHEISSYPPPHLLHVVPVATPGGSMHVQHHAVPEKITPGGRVRHIQSKPAVPLSFDAVKRVEVMDMSKEKAEELMEKASCHLRRWQVDKTSKSPAILRPSVTSAGTVDHSEVDVRPSTSVSTASARRAPRCEYGSDLDSDYDGEFDVKELSKSRQNIPEMEELEEPMQVIVREIDTGMDNAADRLLGTSASFTWVSDFESFRGVREEFTGPTPGPLKDYDSPYDVFTDIWDKDIIELIVLETNRFAQQTIETMRSEGTLKPSSRLLSWTDTNADEIMVLFGMFIYMAIDQRTLKFEYWTLDENIEMPGFQHLMSYDRYVLLNKFLHFVDNDAVESQQLPQTGDSNSARLSAKLGKLAPITEHLEKKFKSLYNLEPNLSFDESLTLFKGRLSWVQTIRSRAARFGIKSYELCESRTGYMAGFQMYSDKVEGSGRDSFGVNLGGKSTKVVLELLQGLEHRGHCVVMDNFYNCPSLARYLKSSGFDCFGTLRVCRRNVPSDIAKVPKNVTKGTIISRHCGDVSIIAWMDSKMVNIISTYHRPDTCNRTRAGKTTVEPVCVKDYNRCMQGIDLKHKYLSMYLLEQMRFLKWYVKMFKRLMNVSIHNARVMYVSSLKRHDILPVTTREFRYELAAALCRRHRPCLVQISQPVGDLMRLRRDIMHEPAYLTEDNNRSICNMCYRKRKIKMVHSKCVQCDVYLCFGDCWRIWHSAAELPGEDIRGRKRKRT